MANYKSELESKSELDYQELKDLAWDKLPEDLRQKAVDILRDKLSQEYMDELEDLIAQKGLNNWLPDFFHYSDGMEIRNILRDGGIRDVDLPSLDEYYGPGTNVRNWDDYYIQCIEATLGFRAIKMSEDNSDPDPNSDSDSDYQWTQKLKGLHGKPGDTWVGPGWRKIVEDCDKQMYYVCPDYRIEQIKEKFGTLRYYWYMPNLDMTEDEHKIVSSILRAIVNQAEHESAKTCEQCGSNWTNWENKVTTEGSWLKTLCQSCRNS